MFRFFCAFSMAVMALPRAAFDARLNETVTAGNWPWWLIDSASVVLKKWLKALSGTALLRVVVVAVFGELVPEALVLLPVSTLVGGLKIPDDGVYNTPVVVAFDPAEADAEEANDEEAPAPDAPEDALA